MKSRLIVFVFCLSSFTGLAQIEPQVDLVTGTASITIPLYTLTEKDLQLPIRLNYSANGVRVTDTDGWVGQNWSISANIGISRQVRGLPDDYLGTGTDTRKGWLKGDMGARIKNYNFSNDDNANTCTDEVVNWNFLNTFQYQDTEPDIFYVSLPGLSFQFYFDENKLPHTVPLEDVKITHQTDATTGQVSSFEITDSNGIKYVFADGEKITTGLRTSDGLSSYYLTRKFKLNAKFFAYNYSWKISSINSPINEHIDFTYKEIAISDSLEYGPMPKRVQYNLPIKIQNTWRESVDIFNSSNSLIVKVLEQITSTSTVIDFTTSEPTFSGVNYIKLNSIQISEKRGSIKLIKKFDFKYLLTVYTTKDGEWEKGRRYHLESIVEKTQNESKPPYKLEYIGVGVSGTTSFPFADTKLKDDWDFYTSDVTMCTLKKINFPLGGYCVLFYEPHQYWNGSHMEQGGGIRIRKTILHDGITSGSDIITNYEYLKDNGETSGKLYYRPKKLLNVAFMDKLNINGSTLTSAWYNDINQQVANNIIPGPASKYFALNASVDLSSEERFNGLSAVVYNYVSIKNGTGNSGKIINEFDLPAMEGDGSANDNEWQPSIVEIARPSTGSAACYEKGSIPLGINQYPYPPNPNYEFARALTKKVTTINAQGSTVREMNYEYQRLYSGSGIRKIYALSLEDLPSHYYYNGAYVDSRIFLYSKYTINTDVKTVLKKQIETLYNSSNLSNNFTNTTLYHYESPNHRELSKVIKVGSDEMQWITRYKYVKDYTVLPSSDEPSDAIKALLTSNRVSTLIESTASYIKNNVENYVSSDLTLFKKIDNNVFPYQQFSLRAPEGISTFVPSSIQNISNSSTFKYDQTNYTLVQSYLNYDSKGNVLESVGRSKLTHSTVWDLSGTLPIIDIDNSTSGEVAFTDFENSLSTNFSLVSGMPTFALGRTDTKALNFSNTGKLVKRIINVQSKSYLLSFWLKAGINGNVTLKFKNGSIDIIAPIQIPFIISDGWKYYSIEINTNLLPASFDIELTTSTSVFIDDVAFFPSHSTVSYCTYNLPFGKSSITDTNGITSYYSYDGWGRLTLVKDQNQHIIKKYDYKTRP